MIYWDEFREFVVLSKIDDNTTNNTPNQKFLNMLEKYFPDDLENEKIFYIDKEKICVKTYMYGFGGVDDGYHILYSHKLANMLTNNAYMFYDISNKGDKVLYSTNFKSIVLNVVHKYLIVKYHTDESPIVTARYTIL